jgi:hypothetical protein
VSKVQFLADWAALAGSNIPLRTLTDQLPVLVKFSTKAELFWPKFNSC